MIRAYVSFILFPKQIGPLLAPFTCYHSLIYLQWHIEYTTRQSFFLKILWHIRKTLLVVAYIGTYIVLYGRPETGILSKA